MVEVEVEVDLYRENGRCMSAPETISRAKVHAITCAEADALTRTPLCAAGRAHKV